MRTIQRLVIAIVSRGLTDDLDEDTRRNRQVFTGVSLFVGVAGPAWGLTYIAFGEPWSGLIPLGYGVLTLSCIALLSVLPGWRWFRTTQVLLIFVLPFALMLSLGGYILGSAVMVWSVLAPIGTLWDGRRREAFGWAIGFFVGAVACGLVEPLLRDSNNLPDWLITTFFVMNITWVAGMVLLLLLFYVGRMEAMLTVMRRNRELERAYLDQEVSLRQADKLATVGKLSAGMAHELNNPAAAVHQAARQLSDTLLVDGGPPPLVDVGPDGVDSVLSDLDARIRQHMTRPEFLDPLERVDREELLQERLEEFGVDDAWELAPALVSVGVEVDDVDLIEASLSAPSDAELLRDIADTQARVSLLATLNESTGRIVEIVQALKSYTYLDQAPVQLVDVHDGLDNTLVMFRSRLQSGIEVVRDYADDVPTIEARGSELNQVWTNLLDNALDAMGDAGRIGITTRVDGTRVVVEITDDGPGIAADIVDQVFDPFVTTKAPGQGTGLGLNIAHNIVTRGGGTIDVASEPGSTRFVICLPRNAPESGDVSSAAAETE